MTKEELYAQLPRFLFRLFTFGLLAAVVFLAIWYFLGGRDAWGYFLAACMKVTAFPFDIHYQIGSSESSAMVYEVTKAGQTRSLTFPVNLMSLVHVQIVTLLAAWPHGRFKNFVVLSLWCLLFTILYQTFNVVIQLYSIEIGPQMASQLRIFWEESAWHSVIKKIASFDMFILRYWAGFPVFMCALIANYFVSGKTRKKAVQNKKA